jgi:very-short-patch-repair endonuclease
MLDRKIILYNPKLKQLAKNLRKKSTLSEVLLWEKLKGRQMLGYNFRRQKPIDNYIVDFFCQKLNLAVEVDGATHGFKIKDDDKRQASLEKLGIKFLRYTESQIRKNLWAVIEDINDWIKKNENKEEK